MGRHSQKGSNTYSIMDQYEEAGSLLGGSALPVSERSAVEGLTRKAAEGEARPDLLRRDRYWGDGGCCRDANGEKLASRFQAWSEDCSIGCSFVAGSRVRPVVGNLRDSCYEHIDTHH